MSASQIRLLNLFIERPGDLISREDISARLWVDTRNIDVATGINTAINRLRSHLDDSPEAPAYIETVIGLGYRFIAVLEDDAAPEPAPHSVAPAGGDLLVAGSHTLLMVAEPSGGDSLDLRIPKSEIAEAMSQQTEVFFPANASAKALPLPEWIGSAPAVTKAFARSRQWKLILAVAGILLIGVAGWVAFTRFTTWRPMAQSPSADIPSSRNGAGLNPVTSQGKADPVSSAAVSPDGTRVAYGNHAGVLVHSFGGSDELLASRPAFEVSRISWSPDSKQLLVSGTDGSTGRHQVWRVPLVGSYPRLMISDADLATFSADGISIAYTREHDTEVWVAAADGRNPRKVESDATGSFPYLLWAFSGDHLLLDHIHAAPPSGLGLTSTTASLPPHGEEFYESVDSQSGALLDREADTTFRSGYVLRDGSVYFAVADAVSPVAGQTRLMRVLTDPKTGRFLEKPKVADSFGGYGRSLSASADGKRLALVLQRSFVDTFVADVRRPGPTLSGVRELSNKNVESYPHAWTPDGSAVLMEDASLGRWAIFAHPLDGSPAYLIAKTDDSAVLPQLTPDSRWVMFLQFSPNAPTANAILRAPAIGGVAEIVPTTGKLGDFSCSVQPGGTCVVRESLGNSELVYYALDPLKGMGQELARTPWHAILLGDWGVSPDGSTVAVVDHDTVHPGVKLLRLGTSPLQARDIPLAGFGTPLGAGWAADGRSLYVQCRTDDGFQLLDLDLRGAAKVLRKSTVPLWAIPSRDGKKIAFPGYSTSDNVWTQELSP
ncbi:winged helix-turn-helix domain-containing protein [Granulicella sibirica]|nr:winged helix-turn-helix domain-containing protein [Granulicella sibirica]